MKKHVFMDKVAKGDFTAKSFTGERFVSYDKTNNAYRVKIKIDGHIYVDTNRVKKEDALALRDAKVAEIATALSTPTAKRAYTVNPTKLAQNLVNKLENLKAKNDNFIYKDTCNKNYKVLVKLLGKTYYNTSRKTKTEARKLRNAVLKDVIATVKTEYKLA